MNISKKRKIKKKMEQYAFLVPLLLIILVFLIVPCLLYTSYIDLDVVESSAAIAFQALALIPADLCDNIVIGCQYEDERDQKNGDKLA